MDDTIEAIERSHELAPTDAKIMYNLALIYDQAGQRDKAIQVLQETIKLKNNYRDAYYALALMYAEKAKEAEQQGNIQVMNENKEQARDTLNEILTRIAPNDTQAKELLQSLE